MFVCLYVYVYIHVCILLCHPASIACMGNAPTLHTSSRNTDGDMTILSSIITPYTVCILELIVVYVYQLRK